MNRARAVIALLALATAGDAAALDCAAIEDATARACCARSLPAQAMRQTLALAVTDDAGTISELGAELAWKRLEKRRVGVRVDLTAPPADAGTIVLLVQDEPQEGEALSQPQAFLYKPSERRDRLIAVGALSGELLGTDFSYEDFAFFYGARNDMHIARLADEQDADGRNVMVLEATPVDADAAFDRGFEYTRIVARLDGERCVVLSSEFYEDAAEPRKVLSADADAIREQDGRWLPFHLTMHDRVEGTRTLVTVESVEFDPNINDIHFARSALKRGR